jgi:hypothetical protein
MDFAHDFLKALFLPGAVSRIRLGGDFLGKISEAVDFCRRSANNSFHDRDDVGRRHIRDSVLLICFRIQLAPAIPAIVLSS